MSDFAALDPDFYKTLMDQLFDGVYFVDRDRRIRYWNKAAERITGYASDEVVGSFCRDNILCHVDGEGRSLCQGACPLTDTIASGRPREVEVFLLHRKGHRLPVYVRTSPIRNQKGQIIGAVEVFSHSAGMARTLDRMDAVRIEAEVDPETGLASRSRISDQLRTRLLERSSEPSRVGVILMRADRLESITQGFGEPATVRVLQAVAQTLLRNVESTGAVGRWNRDEFLVVTGSREPARILAETNKLRALVERCSVPVDSERLFVTLSVGVSLVQENDSLDGIVSRLGSLADRSAALGGGCVSKDF